MLSFCSCLCSRLWFSGRQIDEISAAGVNSYQSLCTYFMHTRLKGNSRNPFSPLFKLVLFLPACPSWQQVRQLAAGPVCGTFSSTLILCVKLSISHATNYHSDFIEKAGAVYIYCKSVGLTTHLSSPQPADWAYEDCETVPLWETVGFHHYW